MARTGKPVRPNFPSWNAEVHPCDGRPVRPAVLALATDPITDAGIGALVGTAGGDKPRPVHLRIRHEERQQGIVAFIACRDLDGQGCIAFPGNGDEIALLDAGVAGDVHLHADHGW